MEVGILPLATTTRYNNNNMNNNNHLNQNVLFVYNGSCLHTSKQASSSPWITLMLFLMELLISVTRLGDFLKILSTNFL